MNDLEKSLKRLNNLLIWGVETDEEIQEMLEKIKNDPNFKFYNLEQNLDSPFHKLPKSEWTEEMIKQYEDFKKESDQKYTDKQLLALAFFCIVAAGKEEEGEFTSVALKADMIKEWGFEAELFDKISSKTAIEKLAIAGAFIAAEIDRINASEKTDDAPIK